MNTDTFKINGVSVLVKFDYCQGEPPSFHASGFPESAEIESVTYCGVDVTELIGEPGIEHIEQQIIEGARSNRIA